MRKDKLTHVVVQHYRKHTNLLLSKIKSGVFLLQLLYLYLTSQKKGNQENPQQPIASAYENSEFHVFFFLLSHIELNSYLQIFDFFHIVFVCYSRARHSPVFTPSALFSRFSLTKLFITFIPIKRTNTVENKQKKNQNENIAEKQRFCTCHTNIRRFCTVKNCLWMYLKCILRYYW